MLLAVAGWTGRDEPGAFGLSALQIALLLAATGPAWWAMAIELIQRTRSASAAGAAWT